MLKHVEVDGKQKVLDFAEIRPRSRRAVRSSGLGLFWSAKLSWHTARVVIALSLMLEGSNGRSCCFMRSFIKRHGKDNKGASMLEYLLLASSILIVALAGIANYGQSLKTKLEDVGSQVGCSTGQNC